MEHLTRLLEKTKQTLELCYISIDKGLDATNNYFKHT